MENHIFTSFPAGTSVKLGELCLELMEEQKKMWPVLGKACHGLAGIQTKLLSCGGYTASVQFNPARLVSSGAMVDQESIKKRPCFLCMDNLLPEQKGIIYKKYYLILCNPAPIFDMHFTIVHVQHQLQAIAGSIKSLLDLAADFSPGFIVFYNGPDCGASAPDHLHFQVVSAKSLPISGIYPDHSRMIRNTPIQIYCAEGINRSAVIMECKNKELLLFQFARLLQATQNTTATNGEPMINVLCSYKDSTWQIIIFFRAKHRPNAYYLEGEKRVFVSPGAIDMAGVIITPLKLDFDRLDGKSIGSIYDEVSLTKEMMNKIIKESINC